MVMKANHKSIFRNFKSNIIRFLTLTSIILVSIAFVTGVGSSPDKIRNSFNEYIQQSPVADIVVKSKKTYGFSTDELDKIDKVMTNEESYLFSSIDFEKDDKSYRLNVMDFENNNINKIILKEGKFPTSMSEAVVERTTNEEKQHKIGDKVMLFGLNRTITGIVENPLIFVRDDERSLLDDDKILEHIYYLEENYNKLLFPKNNLYINLYQTHGLNIFSKKYKELVEEKIELYKSRINDEESMVFLSLEENRSTASLSSFAEKIDVIALIFPVFFIAVTVLVLLTTMSSMIEEERSVIACYETLGYKKSQIISRYLWFSIATALIGCSIGLSIGALLLPSLIYSAFDAMFYIPAISSVNNIILGIIASVVMFLALIGVSLAISLRSLKEQPSDLLRPKAPKPGKVVLLEKIKFVWKTLSFKYKSTVRNIFRFKGRLTMTVVSVAGSTALIMAGVGLFDSTKSGHVNVGESITAADTISYIALVVIVFAGLLSMLVIYNLTNMNISERSREIATLKVLGYHNKEVGGYIYREITIMCIFGIIIGVPCGFGLLYFIFTYIDFGSIYDLHWYSYLITIGVSLFFVIISETVLYHKIIGIDMNDSLKSID